MNIEPIPYELPRNRAGLTDSMAETERWLTEHGKYKVSNLATLVQAVICLGLFLALASVSATTTHYALLVVTWPLQAFLLSGFLGASHDCVHRSHLSSPLANRVAGAMWGSLTTVNFSLYRYFHLDHHRFVGTAEDTEPAGEFDSVIGYFKSLPTIYFFIAFWSMSLAALRGRFPHFVRNAQQRRAVLWDNAALLIWVICIAAFTVHYPREIILGYFVPLILFCPTVFIFSLPEHYGCEHSIDLTSNTRSIISNRIISYLYWNGNYHAEHHVFPRLPSRALPEAHRMCGSAFRYIGKSYFRFHVNLIQSLAAKGKEPLEADGVKVLSPSERIHFHEIANPAERMDK